MIRLVLQLISSRVARTLRVPVDQRILNHGELLRAGAKAEVALGGYKVPPGEATGQARWFSIGLSRNDMPWAYTRGELLATLLCVKVLASEGHGWSGGAIALTAGTDNQGNGFILDCPSSTKNPFSLVLMELSALLGESQSLLTAAWRPREENDLPGVFCFPPTHLLR